MRAVDALDKLLEKYKGKFLTNIKYYEGAKTEIVKSIASMAMR